MEEKKDIKIGLSGEDMKGMLEHEDRPPMFDPKEMMKMMGDKRFDVDAYFASPDAKDHSEGMGAMMRGEMSPATEEYWKNCGKGMKKESLPKGLRQKRFVNMDLRLREREY